MYIIPRNIPNNWCLCSDGLVLGVVCVMYPRMQQIQHFLSSVVCQFPWLQMCIVICLFGAKTNIIFWSLSHTKKNITKQGNLMNFCCINIIYLAVLINSGQHSIVHRVTDLKGQYSSSQPRIHLIET